MTKKVFLNIVKEHWIFLVLGIFLVFLSYTGHHVIVTAALVTIIILQNIIINSLKKITIATSLSLSELISSIQKYFKTLDESLKSFYSKISENEEYKKDKTVN